MCLCIGIVAWTEPEIVYTRDGSVHPRTAHWPGIYLLPGRDVWGGGLVALVMSWALVAWGGGMGGCGGSGGRRIEEIEKIEASKQSEARGKTNNQWMVVKSGGLGHFR